VQSDFTIGEGAQTMAQPFEVALAAIEELSALWQ
jgi:hypothetical protein